MRTTEAAVKDIIEVDDSISLTPFIETANSVVTNICDLSSYGYSLGTLELIERWLSAHYYAIRDKQAASEAAGSVSQSFQYKLGLHFEVTMYGQMAMSVDFRGALAAFQKRLESGAVKPGLMWMGKRCPDRRDY